MRGSKWIPAHTGMEGLFRLVRKAHSMYAEEVATRRKSYHRFATDFINSTQFHDNTDAWSRNEHQKNYQTIADLLRNHEELVRKHFDKEQLDDQMLYSLINEFYASDLVRTETKTDIAPDISGKSESKGKAMLSRKTIALIVRLANEVKLFTELLDVEDTIDRYEKRELKQVKASNNTHLVLILDRLSAENIIPYNWQSLIERGRLILSSSGMKYLDRHQLAATLNRVKEWDLNSSNGRILTIADEYIRQIKGSQSE